MPVPQKVGRISRLCKMFGGGQQQQNAQAMAIPTGISEIDQNESKISSISSLPNRSYSNHAEKRANHNAVERQRRETLNNRFLELAQCIPSLAHVRKPTKSVIVSRSIEFMHDSKLRLESNSNLIKGLKAQNEELKTELNRLRNELGRPPMHFTDPVEEERIAFQTRVQNSNFVRNSQPVYASSLRNGSPFEIANGDDDEDYESTPGSFVQKGNLDIRSPAAQFFTNTHSKTY